jgi:ketosteroid isomerase-like protein
MTEGTMTNLEELEKKVKELEERLQAMEDAEAIRKLHTDYIYCLSNWEFEKMGDCFAENAVEEGIFPDQKHVGKAEIKQMFKEMAANPPQKGGHMLIQPVISVEGAKAEGHWIMYRLNYYFKGPSGQVVNLFGPSVQRRYDCEYVKENGKWKFSRLKFTSPWPEPDPRYEK